MAYLKPMLGHHLILTLSNTSPPGRLIRQQGNYVKQTNGSLLKAIQVLREQSRLVQVEGGHHQGPFHHLIILLPLTKVLKEMIEVKREILPRELHETVLGLIA